MGNETFRDKLARQIALEDESRALGASRYRSRRPLPWRNEPSAADEEAELPPGRQLLKLAIQPTAQAIRDFLKIVDQGGGARTPEAALILSEIGAEEAAYLTGRVILSAMAEGKKLTATAIAVADATRSPTLALDGWPSTSRTCSATTRSVSTNGSGGSPTTKP